jgi:hypothetical protein
MGFVIFGCKAPKYNKTHPPAPFPLPGRGKDQEGFIWGSFTAPNEPFLTAPSLSFEEREGRGGIGDNLGYLLNFGKKVCFNFLVDLAHHGLLLAAGLVESALAFWGFAFFIGVIIRNIVPVFAVKSRLRKRDTV